MVSSQTVHEFLTRPPKIYDRVEAPEGHTCQRWHEDDSGDMVPCNADADFIFVYEVTLHPDDDRRNNCLACDEHTPQVTEVADAA